MFTNFTPLSPEVSLFYKGDYFSKQNFSFVRLNNEIELIFKVTHGDQLARSASYLVTDIDKQDSLLFDGGETKEFYLSGENYILVEAGTKGFNFEPYLFRCSVIWDKTSFTVNIQSVEDDALCAELYEIMHSKYGSGMNRFYECVMNQTLPTSEDDIAISFGKRVQNVIDTIKNTGFLCRNLEDEVHRYICISDVNVTKYLQVKSDGGFFVPFSDISFNEKELSQLKLIKLQDKCYQSAFALLTPVDLLHDLHGKLWLKTAILYHYPQDAVCIAKKFPELYHDITREKEPWREISCEDKISRLPDTDEYTIVLPCEYICGIWGMKRGEFQYCVTDRRLEPFFGLNQGYMTCGDTGIKFVNCKGQEYFILYTFQGKTRYGKQVYATYKFKKIYTLQQIMEVDMRTSDIRMRALKLAYLYQTACHNLVSTPISEDSFNRLDME